MLVMVPHMPEPVREEDIEGGENQPRRRGRANPGRQREQEGAATGRQSNTQ